MPMIVIIIPAICLGVYFSLKISTPINNSATMENDFNKTMFIDGVFRLSTSNKKTVEITVKTAIANKDPIWLIDKLQQLFNVV